jgi:hypothetical protein
MPSYFRRAQKFALVDRKGAMRATVPGGSAARHPDAFPVYSFPWPQAFIAESPVPDIPSPTDGTTR